MRAKTILVLTLAVLLALALSSCRVGGLSRSARSQTAVAEAIGLPQTLAAGATAVVQLTLVAQVQNTQLPTATWTWAVPVPSATAVPAATAMPSATASSSPTPPPTVAPTVALPTPYPTPRPGPVTRISFETGATSAVAQGVVAPRGQNRYRLRASAQQIMMVSLYSASDDLYLAVRGETDGRTLLAADARATDWRGQLSRTQDYRLTVYGGQEETEYTLSIVIPSRIVFKSGATSARLQGDVGMQSTVTYLARAKANQTMTVTITAPTNDVLLTIYGLEDGQPLVRAASGATSWSGTLPATQDYVIDVVGTDAARKYTLDVAIR